MDAWLVARGNKESGQPDSRAGARLRQQPFSLGAKCASSRRVFCHRKRSFLWQKNKVWPILTF